MKMHSLSTMIAVSVATSTLTVAVARSDSGSLPQPESQPSGIDEIVVTAQKRQQKLSDVGITVVAATSEQLKSAGVVDVAQLAKVVPGFSVGNTFAGYPLFSLRGVNFNAGQISAAPAVSTYVDEAIIPYSAMTAGILLDVDHVEVLKGPQGTLFGQNATGGSINVIARKPTDQFTAGLSSEVNHFGQTVLEGYVGGALSQTLRARFAAQTTQGGAWQKGYFANDDKNGSQDKMAGRLLLDWTPTDRLAVGLNLNGNYDHGEVLQTQVSRITPTVPAGAQPGLLEYPLPRKNRDTDIDAGLDTDADNRMGQGVLRVDYSLNDDLTITSITNYIDFKRDQTLNWDATALANTVGEVIGRVETINQELRLAGNMLDSRLHYIFGTNFQKDKIDDIITSHFLAYSALPPGAILDANYHISNKAAGVFANVDFEIAPRVTVLAGARYTSTKQTLSGCTFGNQQSADLLGFIANVFRDGAGLPPSTSYVSDGCLTINDVPGASGGLPDYQPTLADDSQKENNVSWRAGINFKPTSDSLIYGLVSRGYKAGVFPVQNNVLSSTIKPVSQEELTSYEVGSKLALLDDAVRLNLSAFYYDYRDKQFYTFTPLPVVGAGSIIVNVPKSKVKGIDADVTVSPLEGLTLRAAATYVDTKVNKFLAYDFAGNLQDVSGSEFNYAPPWSATVDIEYQFPASGGVRYFVGSNALYNDKTYSNLGELDETLIPDYVVFDVRAGIDSSMGWRASVFVRNLTDKNYWTSVASSGDTETRTAGLPRTYGISLAYSF